MARIDTRRARRMMKQMGLKMDELGDIERVILQGRGREVIIEGPTVTALDMKGQRMYQIAGGNVIERTLEEEGLAIPEEDVLLVAQQAGVSMDRAREALMEAEGDLAKAILMLTKG